LTVVLYSFFLRPSPCAASCRRAARSGTPGEAPRGSCQPAAEARTGRQAGGARPPWAGRLG
jgi:hypothetical protein